MKRILILMLLGAVLFAGAQIPAAAAYAGKNRPRRTSYGKPLLSRSKRS